MRRHSSIIGVVAAILAVTVGVERWMGRSLFGPDGEPGLWEGNIWSSECSQRQAPSLFSSMWPGVF
jgi:hypothetical protein